MIKTSKILLNVIYLILFSGIVFAQRPFSPGFFEAHIFPAQSGNMVFYLYKIPFNRVVFIKEGDIYKSDFRISIEVTDSAGTHITRQIEEKSFSVEKYEETISGDSFFEGLCRLSLAGNKFKLLPVISDLNSSKELKLPETSIDYDSLKNKEFLPPLIAFHDPVKCTNTAYYKLANFNNSIPFSEANYDVIIPAKDTTRKNIYVLVINNKDTVYRSAITENFVSGLLPFECDGNIILKSGNLTRKTKNFILSGLSKTLEEGTIRIIMSPYKNYKDSLIVNMDVKWFNKPFSMLNPADAIKSLKYIESNKLIDSLLDFSKDRYSQELKKYWDRYNTSPDTKFNRFAQEYYSRIDYAMKNYADLSIKNGAETDRGKVYIKYGTPKEIKRSSDQNGKMVEQWIYKDSSLVFIFTDKNGTGNYTLQKK